MIYTLTMNPAVDRTITTSCFRLGETNRVRDVKVEGRGKGINVSLALQQFGVNSVAVAPVGGPEGELIEETLQAAGISHKLYHLSSGRTRVNVKVFDDDAQVTTELNEPGPTLAGNDCEALTQLVIQSLQPQDVLICAGSLPPGVDDHFYAELMRKAQQQGAVCVLDTSGEAFRHGLEARPAIIKPNRVEAEAWFGSPLQSEQDILACLEALADYGVDLVVVSLGSDGAVLRGRDGRIVWAKATHCSVQSTVGCGDVLLAACLAGWEKGARLEEMAQFAVAAATAAAERQGTAFPSLEEVEVSLARVEWRTNPER